MIRFFTYSQFHGKRPPVGSTQIRVNQLIKYWPEADLYKYGENPDVLIFQKVYCTQDYKFPAEFENTTILDICDPDWKDFANVRETVEAVDAVTCPTEPMAKFLRQMTDKPVVVIPDRFDLEAIPEPKKHKGDIKKVVWFGYSHNSDPLEYAMPTLVRMDLELTVISNQDPMVWRWASEQYKEKYTFVKYDEQTIYQELQKADVCILPKGNRPEDRFKSNNKTIKAQLAGLPVATNSDELEALITGQDRQKHIDEIYATIKEEYDVRKSVEQYKDLIKRLQKD